MYNSSGLFQYNHPDWLGSARLFSTPSRGANPAMAYAPFGEGYAGGQQWIQFTSAGNAWTVAYNENQTGSLEDFMFRRYSPSQSRWISPDPAGLAAVDPTNPQTWNRYAYVANNPLSFVDPLGLQLKGPCGSSNNCPGSSIDGGALYPGGGTILWPLFADGGEAGTVLIGWLPLSLGNFGFSGLDWWFGGGGDTNNGRMPSNITCSTVLPNGRTVGSYVSQLSNSINQQAQVASVSTPYGPAPNPSLPSPVSVAQQVYSGTNFRAMFGGPGANYAFLGDAGNFAYGAVSANLGVPLWGAEMVAGAYSLYAHPSSDWGWPWGMDPSARVQVPAGYSAQCKQD